MYTLQFKSMW